jgi:dihydroorotate dehydrogenase (fumarate)
MPDLSTTYLGLKLAHPIVPSSSPLSSTVEGVQRLAEAGAAAVVLPSLFEEQINHESFQLDYYLSHTAHGYAEALSYFPEMAEYRVGPDAYLELVDRSKRAVEVPIIASLNGVSTGGWTEYAGAIQQAGAHALELNVYYLATDPELSCIEVERMYLDVLRDVKASVSIPVAMKLSPYFSALANMAARLAEAGADGLVLFNRFYQPDLDLDTLSVVPNLVLSSPHELRLRLNWVAVLYDRVPIDLAITGGVHDSEGALKSLMAGAKVAMMASDLLRRGPDRIGEVLHGMRVWLEEREYDSVAQLRGSMSQQNVAEPAAFERANYVKALQGYRPVLR